MQVPDRFVFPASMAISILAIVAGYFIVDTDWPAIVIGSVAMWAPTFLVATAFKD